MPKDTSTFSLRDLMTVAARFKVRFGNGMPDDVVLWTERSGFLDFGDDKVRIATNGVPQSTPMTPEAADGGVIMRYARTSVHRLPDIRFIAYEDAGTKSNVAALAVFGVLGLGARRHWTLLTVGFSDREGQFLAGIPAHGVRSRLQYATESSPSLVSLIVEGPPPSVQQKSVNDDGRHSLLPLDEMERLARLYKEGLLTDEEFSMMKEKLLNEQ